MHSNLFRDWMTRFFQISFVAILLFSGSSCSPLDPPELLDVRDLDARSKSLTDWTLYANAIFHNPNDTKLKLIWAEADVYIDDVKVGRLDQEFDLKVDPLAEFTVPVEVKISGNEVKNIIESNGLAILAGRKIPLRITGKVRAKARGFAMTIPFDETDEVKLNL